MIGLTETLHQKAGLSWKGSVQAHAALKLELPSFEKKLGLNWFEASSDEACHPQRLVQELVSHKPVFFHM